MSTSDFTSTKSDLLQIPARSHVFGPSITHELQEQRLGAAAPNSAWRLFRTASFWASLLVISLFSGVASASNLKADTLRAWDEYVLAANTQMQEHLRADHPFVLSDEDPSRAARLRSGEILVWPAGPHIPKRVPSGLIHDWYGEAFIPNATLQDVLPVVRDYGRYKDVYKPLVADSRVVATGASQDRFSMLLMNKSLISKTALDSNFRSSYFRVNDQRWYSVSESTHIQEIADYGSDRQHALPEDEGTGLVWRTYSITRFEEGDRGVYIQIEAIVLSRDIPFSLHWMIEPIVRRVSREALTTSLHQTADAVRSAEQTERYSGLGRCSNTRSCLAASAGAIENSLFVRTK